jgi:GMP synthase (glutamine-hydrolysing)
MTSGGERSGMRALVFEHQSDCGLGRLQGPIARRGMLVELARPADAGSPPDPRGYDLVISLGSDESATDDSLAWVPAELAYVRRAIEAGVPVLGICFGAQMLARALGAEVRPAAVPEVGWKGLTRTAAASSWLPAGPWLVWHEDNFAWPPDATALAWTEAAPQAFRQGDHLGLQFHPEATGEMVDSWLGTDARKLAQLGIDIDGLRRETRRIDEAADAAAQALFDAYLEDVLGV